MNIHSFTSRQKKQEYHWYQFDIWASRLASPWRVFPAYRQAGLPTGRQASEVPKSKENKATGAIADIHIRNSTFIIASFFFVYIF
jgi:hypothetical protein